MARTHGFRIYFVQVFPNQEKGQQAKDVSSDSRTKQSILEALHRLHESGTYFSKAKQAEEGADELPPFSVTVEEPVEVRADLVHVEVATGVRGSHPKARHATKEDPLELAEWSPEASYHVALLFPQSTEDRFILISQVRHRFDPATRLISRLTQMSLEMKKEAQTVEEAERLAIKAAGGKLPAKKKHEKFVYRKKQAADNAYLDALFRDAKSATAKLTSYGDSARGGKKPSVDRELSIRLRGSHVTGIGRKVAQKWRDAKNKSQSMQYGEGVSELAEELSGVDLLGAEEAQMYDKASLTIVSSANERTVVAVDTLTEAFTYPVSDGKPGIFMHYDRVSERVAIVAKEAGINVEEIDPTEVSECLEDLAQKNLSVGSLTD